MLSLKAQSQKTEKRTESARATDSRALTFPPGGNAILAGVLSSVSLQWQFCYAAFAEEGFTQSATSSDYSGA